MSEDNGTPTEIVPVIDSGVVLMPVMNIQAAKQRLAEFQEFVKGYLVPDEDYGLIPGTPKPTLFKPGADKLCELYGLADDFLIESRVENYSAEPPLFDYTIKCTLLTRRDGRLVGTGFGSCNSWEGKYRFRDSKRKCPLCGKETIIKGKEEYGGGWLCWKKKDGCGAKFVEDDKAITEQKAGKELNDDVPTLKNTILKMAKKRAKIDAVIAVTRSSGIFTQDMEDIVDHDTTNGAGTKQAAERVAQEKISKAKAKQNSPNAQPTLFYVEPPEQNGHYVEFINIKQFIAGQPDIEDSLRLVFTAHKARKTKNDTALVPAEQVEALCQKLTGDLGLTIKKLEAR